MFLLQWKMQISDVNGNLLLKKIGFLPTIICKCTFLHTVCTCIFDAYCFTFYWTQWYQCALVGLLYNSHTKYFAYPLQFF